MARYPQAAAAEHPSSPAEAPWEGAGGSGRPGGAQDSGWCFHRSAHNAHRNRTLRSTPSPRPLPRPQRREAKGQTCSPLQRGPVPRPHRRPRLPSAGRIESSPIQWFRCTGPGCWEQYLQR